MEEFEFENNLDDLNEAVGIGHEELLDDDDDDSIDMDLDEDDQF